MLETRLTIYALNIDASDRRLAFVSGSHLELISCASLPAQFAVNSLCLVFPLESSAATSTLKLLDHYPCEQILLVVDPQASSERLIAAEWQKLAPWLKVVAPSSRMIDEAWSQVLRAQLNLEIQKLESHSDPTRLTCAFLASALAQMLRRDLSYTREAIIQALHGTLPDLQNIWPVNLPQAHLITAAAALALSFQDKTEEEFRLRLRELSSQIPFKLRSELRLATDRCFAMLWRKANAA